MKSEHRMLRTIALQVLDGKQQVRNPRALCQALVELVNAIETMENAPPPAPVLVPEPMPAAVDAAYRFFCGLNAHVKYMSPQLGREYREHISALGQVLKGGYWHEAEIRRQKEASERFVESANRQSAKDRMHAAEQTTKVIHHEMHPLATKVERQAAKVARFNDGLIDRGARPSKVFPLNMSAAEVEKIELRALATASAINDSNEMPTLKMGPNERLTMLPLLEHLSKSTSLDDYLKRLQAVADKEIADKEITPEDLRKLTIY